MDMQPALFGITHSNRDFSKTEGWSKNKFNATFPIALCCYMHAKALLPYYLIVDHTTGQVKHTEITVTELFGVNPTDPTVFYAFENDFTAYRSYVMGRLPRIDVVIQDTFGTNFSCFEIKLTALPDNSTARLEPFLFGCELVVRPDTIVYLALSIASHFYDKKHELLHFLSDSNTFSQLNWNDTEAVVPYIYSMTENLNHLFVQYAHLQTPLVLQSIWKTQGKLLTLDENAFDTVVWSNFAFARLFFYGIKPQTQTKLSRQARSVLWLYKMLFDFAQTGQINYKRVIDELSHDTKNDKAFAVSGRITRRFLPDSVVIAPRISRQELKRIILGNGQHLLSPERRLDAAILNTPGLFER
jgi:hypothetical protein